MTGRPQWCYACGGERAVLSPVRGPAGVVWLCDGCLAWLLEDV